MGQYHYLVNLTKKEFVHPHQIGNGLKLREQVGWPYSTSTALTMLLAASNGRGGGDFLSKSSLVGSWAGDKIAFIGDYAEKDDVHNANAQKINHDIDHGKGGWKNISPKVRQMMVEEFGISYTGDGWLTIKEKA